ncbi:MAG: hypothetical protein MZV70_56775 [Desulfobacterales bacterium]|nr:hypothetical protein [Desulfobacterales bacterium]
MSASQQALDIDRQALPRSGRLRDRRAGPTYVGALQAIQSYQGKVLGIPFTAEQDGFDMDVLEKTYAERDRRPARGSSTSTSSPTSRIPTGFCWSLAKRKALLEFAYSNELPHRRGLALPRDPLPRRARSLPSTSSTSSGEPGHRRQPEDLLQDPRPGRAAGLDHGRRRRSSAKLRRRQAGHGPLHQRLRADVARRVPARPASSTTSSRATWDNYRDKRNLMCEIARAVHAQALRHLLDQARGRALPVDHACRSTSTPTSCCPRRIEQKVAYVVGSAFYARRARAQRDADELLVLRTTSRSSRASGAWDWSSRKPSGEHGRAWSAGKPLHRRRGRSRPCRRQFLTRFVANGAVFRAMLSSCRTKPLDRHPICRVLSLLHAAAPGHDRDGSGMHSGVTVRPRGGFRRAAHHKEIPWAS